MIGRYSVVGWEAVYINNSGAGNEVKQSCWGWGGAGVGVAEIRVKETWIDTLLKNKCKSLKCSIIKG